VLFLSLALLAASRDRELLAGLAFGAAILCRPHLGIAVGVFVVYCYLCDRRARRGLMVTGAGVGVALYLAYNVTVYGSPSPLGGYDPSHVDVGLDNLIGLPENVAGALVSPGRGLLLYSPVLVFMGWAIVPTWRGRVPVWVRAATLAALAYAAVQLYLLRFSGGDRFYGNRVLLESLVLAWPLLMMSAQRTLVAGGRAASTWFGLLTMVSTTLVGVGAAADYLSDDALDAWQELPAVAAVRLLSPPALASVLLIGAASAALVARLSRQPEPGRAPDSRPLSSPASTSQRQESSTQERPAAPIRAASSRSSSSSDTRAPTASGDRPSTT
jgi:alpha-1,2-mannosyltransferase